MKYAPTDLTVPDTGPPASRNPDLIPGDGVRTGIAVQPCNNAPMMSAPPISITVNGESRSLPQGHTIADLVAELKVPSKFVAVERNRSVVPRARHSETVLADGDQLEVVTLVGGG